jgi:hypothetical protein
MNELHGRGCLLRTHEIGEVINAEPAIITVAHRFFQSKKRLGGEHASNNLKDLKWPVPDNR